MIILSKPYVSEVLTQTLRNIKTPVVKADHVIVANEQELKVVTERALSDLYQSQEFPSVLCNSEASLQLLCKNLEHHPIGKVINLFKNKAAFRQFIQDEFPHFFYQTIRLNEWDSIDPSDLPFPVVIKPVVGYSSIGVYRLENAGQWFEVKRTLQQVLAKGSQMYSKDVVNANELIIEQWLDGTEYAIDAYFDSNGSPIILNIFARKFMHQGDTSDRIYYTSKYVIKELLGPITEFLSKVGKKLNLVNFPLHAEVRKTTEGHIVPVEINPMRFAGIGTTELGIHAYGINSYESFFQQMRPDWDAILHEMDDAVYSFFCAEYELNEMEAMIGFDHEGLKKSFQNILEYRIMPEEFNTFAVVFYRSETHLENHRLLRLNLAPFMISEQNIHTRSLTS